MEKWMKKKDEILKYIEENQPEVFWDYDSELSDEQIDKILSEEDGLREVMDNIENVNDSFNELEDSLYDAVREKFDLQESDSLRDFCFENTSVDLNMKTLFRLTGQLIFFFDTGFELGEIDYKSAADLRNDIKAIKKVLKIKTKDYDEALKRLLSEAYYGGQLVIYFMMDLNELLDNISLPTISFKDMHVAIIDTKDGSGSDCFLTGTQVEFPFSRNKLFYENTIKYNYSFAVCGMYKDWCKDTQVSFSDKKLKVKKAETESGVQVIKRNNALYDEAFKEGKCTYGDMDINRHRHTEYINEFPCGTHCLDCGTFWVD